MERKDAVMQEIFSELTERNKDIMILVAKSVIIAQEDARQQNIAFNQHSKSYEYMDTGSV